MAQGINLWRRFPNPSMNWPDVASMTMYVLCWGGGGVRGGGGGGVGGPFGPVLRSNASSL